MKKNKEQNETLYRMTMCAAVRMLKDGLISAGEYTDFEQQMRGKYSPEYSQISFEIDLI